MTSAGYDAPSVVTTAVGSDALDRCANQLDVRLLEARQPDAVVLQCPLGGRRIVGHHLREQVGVVTDVRENPPGEQLARHLVRLVDREAVAVVEVRVDA